MSYYMVLLLVASGLSMSCATSVYISNNGNDNKNCGSSIENSCKSLQYAFDIQNETIDCVILEGGDEASMIYYINETITLSNNITFVSNNSHFIPIITQNQSHNKYPFADSFKSSISISFKSILFVDINIFNCKNNACFLSLHNCTILQSVKNEALPYRPLLNFRLSTTERSTLDIKNCSFTGFHYIISSNASISMFINDTIISGGCIWYEPKDTNNLLLLIIDNVVFSNYGHSPEVIHIKTYRHPRVYILNSKFYNITETSALSVECLSGLECRELSKPIILKNTSLLNCTSNSSLLSFQYVNVEIEDSLIKNNYIPKVAYFYETNTIMRGVDLTRNKLIVYNFFFQVVGGKLNISFWKVKNNCGNGLLLRMTNLNFALIDSVELTMNTIAFFDVYFSNNVTSSNNLISQNGFGIMSVFSSKAITISNNTFMENNAPYIVFVQSSSTISISSNKFIGNNDDSFIVDARFSTGVTMSNNNFITNVASCIVHILSSAVTINNNGFIKNCATESILHALESTVIKMDENSFTENDALLITDFKHSSTWIRNNILTENKFKKLCLRFHNSNVSINGLVTERNSGPTEISIESDAQQYYYNFIENVMIKPKKGMSSDGEIPFVYIDLKKGEFNTLNVTIRLPIYSYIAMMINTKYVKKIMSNRLGYFDLSCPTGSKLKIIKRYQNSISNLKIQCNPCKTGTYSVNGGAISETLTTSITDRFFCSKEIDKELGVCKICPTGGICVDGITRSRGHFHGFIHNEIHDSMEYIPCPKGYCCSNEQECVSHDTCRNHRNGTLCGECQNGYQQDFFSIRCIKKNTCKNHGKFFWTLFLISVILSVIIVIFLDVIPLFIKKCYQIIKKKISYRKRDTINQIESFEMEVQNTPFDNLSTETRGESDRSYQIDERITTSNVQKPYTISGILGVLISYYQVKSLLETIKVYSIGNVFNLMEVFSKILNLDIFFQFSSSICFSSDLDIVGKQFIRNFLFNIMMPVTLLIITFMYLFVKKCLRKSGKLVSQNDLYENSMDQQPNNQFIHRLGINYVRILLLIYKNLSFFTLTMLKCVSVNNTMVLYIQGNQVCYQSWQYILMVFLAGWVIPFPITLWQSFNLFKKNKINFTEFLLCLTIPMVLIWYLIRSNCCLSCCRLHHPFHQRLLAEVLTDSYRDAEDGKPIFWEHWRLIQRLLLSIITVFTIYPLEKSCYTMILVLLFIAIYYKVQPYKPHLKLEDWCEVASLLSFCFVILLSTFNAFLLTFNISSEEAGPTLVSFYNFVDYILSPITVLVVYFILRPFCKWLLKPCGWIYKSEIFENFC